MAESLLPICHAKKDACVKYGVGIGIESAAGENSLASINFHHSALKTSVVNQTAPFGLSYGNCPK